MGGPAGGHVASQTAADFVKDMLERDLKPDMPEQSLRAVMLSAAAGANAMVYDAAKKDPELAGMGTTMILAVFSGEHIFAAHAGDSRIYRIEDGKAVRLTKDHTVVQMLLDIGEITEEEAKDHPKRHFITRAVGVGPAVDADFSEYPFLPGAPILICSDGLYNYVEEDTLPGLVARALGEKSAAPLIDLANEGGGGDNITAVIVLRE
jgi:protein phosphatase